MTLTGLKNVKFVNCYFDGQGSMFAVRADNCTNVTIQNCEITNASDAGVYGSGFNLLNSYIHHIGGDGIKANHDVVIQGNYIAFLGWNNDSAHADGIQIPGGSNFLIQGNFFDMGRDVANTKSNSAVFAQGNFSNLTVDGNWMRGGNYTIHAYDDVDDYTSSITNNIFYTGSSAYGFGHIDSSIGWSGNLTDLGKVALTSTK